MEDSIAVSPKVKANDPAILLLGLFPKELKTGTQTVIYTPIAALFAIAKR